MPPLQYLALHWNAKISSADLQALSHGISAPANVVSIAPALLSD
jgi:hypothetical protein